MSLVLLFRLKNLFFFLEQKSYFDHRGVDSVSPPVVMMRYYIFCSFGGKIITIKSLIVEMVHLHLLN